MHTPGTEKHLKRKTNACASPFNINKVQPGVLKKYGYLVKAVQTINASRGTKQAMVSSNEA